MTDQEQPIQQGNRLVPVQVSRSEELLYGASYAPLVRRMAQTADAAEQAVYQTQNLLKASYEDDSIVRGLTNPPESMDERGTTEHTRWLESVEQRLSNVRTITANVLQVVSVECIEREHETRAPRDPAEIG